MLPSQKSEILYSVSLWSARQLFPETKTRLCYSVLLVSILGFAFGYKNKIEDTINSSLNFQSICEILLLI